MFLLCVFAMGCINGTAALTSRSTSSSHNSGLLKMALGARGELSYLTTSAVVGWYRSTGQWSQSEWLLGQQLAQQHTPGLQALYALWYGDEALFTHRHDVALERYQAALKLAGSHAFLGRLLSVEIRGQIATTLWQMDDFEGADNHLKIAAEQSSSLNKKRYRLLRADGLWQGGHHVQARRLRNSVPELDELDLRDAPDLSAHQLKAQRRRLSQPGRRPRLSSVKALSLKAPWEWGTRMRAGGIGPEFGGWFRFMARAFTRGTRKEPCGRGLAGYYYDRGSHSPSWHNGRDRYAVDFTRGNVKGPRIGNDSFGIQLRASASGIVSSAYYGTPTHWDAWKWGPVFRANRVILNHVDTKGPQLSVLLQDLEANYAVQLPHAYQTWFYHLVGLRDACLRGDTACIERPGLLSFGQYVWQGTPLGYVDSSGYSTIDHLHFSLMKPCGARDERCRSPDPHLTHVSVPLILEGQYLGPESTAQCLLSSNAYGEEELDNIAQTLIDVEPR